MSVREIEDNGDDREKLEVRLNSLRELPNETRSEKGMGPKLSSNWHGVTSKMEPSLQHGNPHCTDLRQEPQLKPSL